MSFDEESTIGRVKDLVWNAWPNDWQDERPPSPAFLRVLYLGRILQDDETLASLKLPAYSHPPPASHLPTIVHLAVRPVVSPADDDRLPKKKKSSATGPGGRRANNSSAGLGEIDAEGENADSSGSSGCCGCIIC